jgi:small subunit ribosomal protein S6
MNKYEMIYILDTACTDEKRDALIAKVENVVAKAGGSVEKTEKWGVKKLAYAIDYKTEGYYVYMAFEGDCNLVQEMKRVVGISEGVIRRLITRR